MGRNRAPEGAPYATPPESEIEGRCDPVVARLRHLPPLRLFLRQPQLPSCAFSVTGTQELRFGSEEPVDLFG